VKYGLDLQKMICDFVVDISSMCDPCSIPCVQGLIESIMWLLVHHAEEATGVHGSDKSNTIIYDVT